MKKWIRISTLFSVILLLAFTSPQQKNLGTYKLKTVVLDAGHGGYDSGAHGTFSYEKNVTLALVLKLGALIEKNCPDIKVIYTRNTDTFIELYERAAIANRNNADLFISIHCNANKSTIPSGTETYLMGLHKSEGNLEVSQRENSVVLMEDNYAQNYDGFDPNSPEAYIMFSMNQNAHIDQSILLASNIENEFSKSGREDRGVKQAGFLVLWRTTMPAILCETGFITNPTEEKYLNSVEGQNQIAQNIFDGFLDYKKSVETESIEQFNQQSNDEVMDTIVQAPTPLPTKTDTVIKQTPNTNQTQISSGTIYKVQLAAMDKPYGGNDAKYNSIGDIESESNGKGMYRYMVGNFSNYDDAVSKCKSAQNKGFKDAFIVEYKNGVRVTTHYIH